MATISLGDTLKAPEATPTLNPYKPAPIAPVTSPVNTFYTDKLQSMQQNMAPAPTPIPEAPHPAAPVPTPSPSAEFQVPPQGAANLQSLYGTPAPPASSFKPADVLTELRTQDPATVSAKAYQMDPSYKNFVDYYQQGGAMAKLPEWAQKNFDQFALNTHYRNTVSPERMPDRQVMTVRPDAMRAPDSVLGKAASLVTAVPAIVAGGILDSIDTVLHPLTGQGFTDEDPFNMSRWISKTFTPQSFENNVRTASHELELVGSLMQSNPITALPGTVLSGFAGAADISARGMQGEDVSVGQMLTEAGKQAAFTKIFGPLAKGIPHAPVLGSLMTGGTTAIQRMYNQGVIGGTIAPIATGISGLLDIPFGKDPKEIPMDMLKAIPFGFGTAFIFQGGIEGAKQLPVAIQNWISRAHSPEAQNRATALENDSASEEVMRSGVSARDVVHLQDMTPDERAAAIEVNDTAREIMLDKGSNANLKTVQGRIITDNLSTVGDIQDAAGKELGAIRSSMPTQKTLSTAPGESAFTSWLDRLGISVDPKQNLDMSNSLVDDTGNAFLKRAWSLLPDNQSVSPVQIDKTIQQLNTLMKDVPVSADMSSTRAALFALKDGLRTELIQGLPENLRPQYVQASESYAKAMEVMGGWARILKVRGENNMSVGDLKRMISTGSRDLKAGEIARRLLGNAEGSVMPMFTSLQDLITKNPYTHGEWDGNILNVVKYTDTVEKLLKLQPSTGLSGEVKAAQQAPTSNIKEIVSHLLNLFGKSPQTMFDSMDGYLHHLQANGPVPSADSAAIASDIGKDIDPKAEALNKLLSSVKSPVGENRTVNLKGGMEGTPGIDYAAPPPTPTSIPDAGDHEAVMKYSSDALGTTPDKLVQIVKNAGDNNTTIKAELTKVFGQKFTGLMDRFEEAVMNGDAPIGAADFTDPIRRAVFGDVVLPPVEESFQINKLDASPSAQITAEPELAHISVKDYEAIRKVEQELIKGGMSQVDALSQARTQFLKKP